MHVMRKYNAKPQRICIFFYLFYSQSSIFLPMYDESNSTSWRPTRREFYAKNFQIRILNRGQVEKRIQNMSTYSPLYYSQTILNIVIFQAHINSKRLQTYKKWNKLICCGCLKIYRQVAKSLLILSLCDLGKERFRHKLKLYQSLEVPLNCMVIVKAMCHTFLSCLSRAAGSAIEAISLALHSRPSVWHIALRRCVIPTL